MPCSVCVRHVGPRPAWRGGADIERFRLLLVGEVSGQLAFTEVMTVPNPSLPDADLVEAGEPDPGWAGWIGGGAEVVAHRSSQGGVMPAAQTVVPAMEVWTIWFIPLVMIAASGW